MHAYAQPSRTLPSTLRLATRALFEEESEIGAAKRRGGGPFSPVVEGETVRIRSTDGNTGFQKLDSQLETTTLFIVISSEFRASIPSIMSNLN